MASDPSAKYPHVKANFKRLRKASGLKIHEIAERVGVAKVTVESWSKGARRPDGENLVLLARVFRCAPEEIILPQRPPDSKSV